LRERKILKLWVQKKTTLGEKIPPKVGSKRIKLYLVREKAPQNVGLKEKLHLVKNPQICGTKGGNYTPGEVVNTSLKIVGPTETSPSTYWASLFRLLIMSEPTTKQMLMSHDTLPFQSSPVVKEECICTLLPL
jgi:hypothetical protein